MWTELTTQGLQLADLQSYVTLRGSTLSSEDKKRVLLAADRQGQGQLEVKQVTDAIKMLGAGFFHEMTGVKKNKGRTYDHVTLISEGLEEDHGQETFHTADIGDPVDDEEFMDTLINEGDTDATLIAEFENAASDLIQSDEELAGAFNSYTEARRRLTEKVRSRGFWPISQAGKNKSRGKGKGKVKGKFAKGHQSSRRSLDQRILTSECRICNQIGHWKAECPYRHGQQQGSNPTPTAPTTFASADVADAMPMEFLNIPRDTSTPLDADPQYKLAEVFFGVDVKTHPKIGDRSKLRGVLNLHKKQPAEHPPVRNEPTSSLGSSDLMEHALFATHGSFGVVDLGATKTVIGSNLVKEFIQGLSPAVQKTLTRCPCQITFRFGNHGTLKSEQALVVPLQDLKLKIAVVPGSTPFLISNTLLRALRAVIDVDEHNRWSKKLQRTIPMELTSRGLFLLDLNELATGELPADRLDVAETHTVVRQVKTESQDAAQGFCSETCKVTGSQVHPSSVSDAAKAVSLHSQSQQHPNTQTCSHTNSEKSIVSELVQNVHDDVHSSFESQSVSPSRSVHEHGIDLRTSQEAAGGGSRGSSRSEPVHHRGHGEHEGGLRSHPSRQDIPRNVGQGTAVDHVVQQPLCQVQEGIPPSDDALHSVQAGTSRVDTRANSCENISASSQGPDSGTCAASTQDCSTASQSQSTSHLRAPGGIRSPDAAVRDRDRWSGMGSSNDDNCSSIIRSESSGTANAAHGEHAPGHDGLHGEYREPAEPSSRSRTVKSESPTVTAETEMHQLSPETCKERALFHRLVQKYAQELNQVEQNMTRQSGARLDILEVFCGSQSQLTHQGQKLGYQAERLGLEQCDLQTWDGRQMLFKTLVQERPKNVWYSPTCGPWSGWSSLNASRSLSAWDELHRSRLKHVEQIALGVVILRFQLSHQDHLHWEQPKPSLMFKLPYLSELFYYTLAVDFDMCMAGHLRDPSSGMPIKKSLTVMTTSQNLVKTLQHFRCPGTHEHQVIEGTCTVNGVTMNRSAFTEHYHRKFARTIVKTLCQNRFIKEPLAVALWCLPDDLILAEDQARKRRRLITVAKPKPARSSEVTSDTGAKRRKILGKQSGMSPFEKWTHVFDQVDALLPRVGKRQLDDHSLQAQIQELFPDKEII